MYRLPKTKRYFINVNSYKNIKNTTTFYQTKNNEN